MAPTTTTSSERTMTTPAVPLKEFDAEMASTRKLLARVPSAFGVGVYHGQERFRPDKSIPAGYGGVLEIRDKPPVWVSCVLHASSSALDTDWHARLIDERRENLIDRLPEALDLLPADCTPVVFHTAVLAYVRA